MEAFLTLDDLSAFASIDEAKGQAMIDDATATALLAAPCLAEEPTTLSGVQVAAVRAILRGAVLRWHEAGTGALSQKAVNTGPFGASETYDTRQNRRGMFWPSELTQLQNICGGVQSSGAFGIDTVGNGFSPVHADICSVNFGGACSCGAILTGSFPLYGG